MKKLLELLNLRPTEGLLGVEIEVEGNNLPVEGNRYWRAEQDGSLRNGMEYVMVEPMDLKKLSPALKTLQTLFNKAKSKLAFSFRTSVHMHVNVQDLTPSQIYAMIYTYSLLEGPLMTFCGEDRKCNRFCLRFEDAEAMAYEIGAMFYEGDNGVKRRPNDRMRYAALNIEALSKYGSLEFRAMEGSMDIPRLVTWGAILNNIREYAIRADTPTQVFDNFNASGGPIEFLTSVVGKEIANTLTTAETIPEILRSFSITLDLPFEYKRGVERRAEQEVLKADPMIRGHFHDLLIMDELDVPIAVKPVPAPQVREKPVIFLTPGDFRRIKGYAEAEGIPVGEVYWKGTKLKNWDYRLNDINFPKPIPFPEVVKRIVKKPLKVGEGQW